MMIFTILSWIFWIYVSGFFLTYFIIYCVRYYDEDDDGSLDWDDVEELLGICKYSWFGVFLLSVMLIQEWFENYKKNNKPPKWL